MLLPLAMAMHGGIPSEDNMSMQMHTCNWGDSGTGGGG